MTGDQATVISAYANVVVAVVAVAALIAAASQISATRQISAFQMFLDVFKVDIEHTYIDPNNSEYGSYIALVFTSYEQVLSSTRLSFGYNKWRESIKDNLKYYIDDLKESDGSFNRFQWLKYYDRRLVDLMEAVVLESVANGIKSNA